MCKALFRGKGNRKYNDGSWYEGYLIKDSDGDYQIFFNGCIRVTVLEDTIGRYTGKTIKNIRLYQDDVCKSRKGLFRVIWNEKKAAFMMEFYETSEMLYLDAMQDDAEIIGNIHDNPEYWRETEQ